MRLMVLHCEISGTASDVLGAEELSCSVVMCSLLDKDEIFTLPMRVVFIYRFKNR